MKSASVAELQELLDQAVTDLVFELSSPAAGCAGRAPIVAHAELLVPRRPLQPTDELAHFDLRRVDAYLASRSWERRVGTTGQISLGGQRYSVGRCYAQQQVQVCFDASERQFVFALASTPEQEIGRRKARDLEVADLTGLAAWPGGLGAQQLPLPLVFAEGVSC